MLSTSSSLVTAPPLNRFPRHVTPCHLLTSMDSSIQWVFVSHPSPPVDAYSASSADLSAVGAGEGAGGVVSPVVR